MAGDAEATRRRLLDAATDEFAKYGIAGARVDRIAESAKANKAQIYHYFGSKEGLFDAVFNRLVAQVLREAPIDPTDLPEYAGRLCDGYERNPQVARLASWLRLERAADAEPLRAIVDANGDKFAAIAAAQKAGTLSKRFGPGELLVLVLSVAGMWAALSPEFEVALGRRTRAQRRKVVVDAVAALIAP